MDAEFARHLVRDRDKPPNRPPSYPESAARAESSFGPGQRIRALQIDVIGDQHQRALDRTG